MNFLEEVRSRGQTKVLLGLAALGLLAGCHSNPYDKMQDRLTPQPVVVRPAAPVFDIEAPEVVDMTEGEASNFRIKARVLSGDPVVTFEGLPKGAVYDAATGEVHWTPPMGAAVDPSNPLSTTNSYQVRIFLTSTEEKKSRTRRSVVILVHHRTEDTKVLGFEPKPTLREGEAFVQTIEIVNSSFPKGPFSVSIGGAPEGVVVEATSEPTKFLIKYTPPYSAVTSDSYTRYCYLTSESGRCKITNWTLHVFDSRRYATSFQTEWSVLDKKREPNASVPSSVEGSGLAAEFYIQVDDPNGEMVPEVKIEGAPMGVVSFITVQSNEKPTFGNPGAMMRAVWTGLPSSVAGTKQKLDLKICTARYYSDQNCVNRSVEVSFPEISQ